MMYPVASVLVVTSQPGRLVVLGTALASVLSLAACSGAAPSSSPSSSAAASTVASTAATATATPSGSPSPSGLTDGPVLAVKIDHTTTSAPRIGIGSADVIYVEPVEAGINRLLAIFSSTLPARVGPVRSARESDVPLLANYGKVAFAFSGGSAFTMTKIRAGAQVNVSFDQSGTGYYRDAERPAPYNVIGIPADLVARAGGSVPPGDIGFRYGPAAPGGTPATRVSTRWAGSAIAFTFNADLGSFTVTSDGRTETDALTGAAVAPTNVIVQYVRQSPSGNHDVNGVNTPIVNVVGTGAVAVLRDGQAWTGTWQRASAKDPMKLTSAAGQQITLAQGQTWVLLVPRGQSAPVS